MKHTCDLMLPFILGLFVSFTATVGNNQCGEIEKTDFQNPPDGVCGSLHIRSNMSQFRKLENCTVVEGYLRISLMEKVSPEEYDKWSFPELREITAYLTLYRVYGLKSLKNLFPNLAIIGGRQLFNNYALVAFEMTDLEELGLVSLRTISRGGVRITKSKKLCYVDTVDWEFLGVDPGAQDFKDNKEESQCANYCPDDCLTTKVGNVEAKRCWTSQHCQQGLNCQCKMNQTCMDNGTCCHEYCLGGCSGTGADDCFSCKGVTYQGRCLEECPDGTYKYADRRCLTANECFSLANSTDSSTKNIKIVRSDKAEMRLCVSQCPQNYTVQVEGEFKNFECIKCKEFCPKGHCCQHQDCTGCLIKYGSSAEYPVHLVCNGSEVNSIEDAQKLKDCSKITGSLLIQIMGGSNVAYEMEKSLGNIKEVTGSISIRRSYALLTLYFLRNLEIIGGEQLYDRRSFTVMDNINLQDLFPEEQMKKMKIKNGTVSFQSNRKLCKSKINRFVQYLNMTTLDNDIGVTNGNLIPCVERELSLNVTSIYDTTVLIQWEKDASDGRHVLAYIINYKEIKSIYDDINIYEGRDACSADVWMTNEVLHVNESQPYESSALTDLRAYTHYAVYVQAYTLSTATYSAMTAIKTFRTNAYYPSEPLDLEVISDDPHELYVRWKPPKLPNGIVTHYKVLYQKQDLDIKSFEQRDYCTHPISTPSETKKRKEEEAEKVLNTTAGCCACPKTKVEREAEARKREIEIYFENYLHDQVYCKRYDTLPADIVIDGIPDFTEFVNPGRSVHSRNITASRNLTDNITAGNMSRLFTTNTSESDDNVTDDGSIRRGNLTLLIQEVIVNDTDIYLPNLEHFQEYSIEVQACHDTEPHAPSYTKLCSNRALTAGRTKASWVMDKINESTIHVQVMTNDSTDAIITWEPPPKPNGLILTYNVFYKKAQQENLMPQHACITIREFQKFPGCRLTNLDPGNWTFRINAMSLAGNGSLTEEHYFIVKHSPDEEAAKNEAVIIIAIIAVLILIVSVIGVWLVTKYKFRTDEMTVISPNVNYIPSEPTYTMDGWEVDRDKIKLIKELGQGSFGMVYEGIAKGINDDPDEEIRVAVKTVNDRASFNDKREFLKEATTMKAFDCFHVVKLLGVVSTGQPALVIMELMALGDLKNYLREHRPDEQERPGVSPPKIPDILKMAGEIADGMAYLADKKFVHRDLAARNCMVAEDLTVKIGDFGMTRDIYETDYYRKGGRGMLPVRWMAPESIRDGVFTSMSDVWSYGVVLWEMVTLAAQPYQGLSNEEVVKFVSENNAMDIPDGSPEDMAYLMHLCWKKKPNNRPTFKEIIEYLLPHCNNDRFEKVSYFFNAGGGPRGMDPGDAEDPFQEEDSNDSCSFKSLSYEARAAPQLSHSSNSGNHQYHSSPHPSGGSVSQCDDRMNMEDYGNDHERASGFFNQRRGSCLNDSFEDFGDHSIHNEFGVDIDDSNQSFMPDDFQAIPLVKTWHSPMLSRDQGGNESTQHNSGLVELQPLIKKDYGPSASSSRLASVHPPSPYPSDFIGHQTSPATTYELRTPGGSQTLQQHHTAAADYSASGSPSGSSHLGQSNRLSSGKQALSLDSRPALRLPVLNSPPSGGFYRVSLHKQDDKDSNSGRNSQGNIQPSSGDWEHHQPSPATADAIVVSKDETSPDSTSQHNLPPAAITSSSDDSKESSKSSGSYSQINGLKNGHIPMVRHRTAPC